MSDSSPVPLSGPSPSPLPAAFLAQLKTIFDSHFYSHDSSDLETFGKDWTKVYEPKPALIFFPQTTANVSQLLKLCSQYKIAVVPSGGRTGLSGGAVAAHGEVVISFDKMRGMGEVNALSQTVSVQAGAITEAVHEHCAPFGLTWPVDFASKGSSTVGGNIATNAGGVKVIRYGLTRNWVLGLTVVLMDGSVLELNGALEKNNTGIDLRQIFIGTEGIMGVVTEAILKLTPLPREQDVFFFGLENLADVFELFQNARKSGFVLNAFECLSDECLQVVLNHRALKAPLSEKCSYYVLMEVERPNRDADHSTGESSKLDTWLEDLLVSNLVKDAVLAQTPKEAAQLWAMREGISESLAATGLLHKHDIALPLSRLQEFIETWTQDLEKNYPGLKPYIFGHIGDGNLHVNVMKPEAMEVSDFRALCKKADEGMFQWIKQFEGSVSAEHGIGLLKKHLLQFTRSPAEIALMKQMKLMFDPENLLNPGKIF